MPSALLIVDVQNDFCPGGSLAVDGGDRVAGGISRLLAEVGDRYQLIAATADWHPAPEAVDGGFDHFSTTPDFVDTWPAHCVQDTVGARFHPDLALSPETVVVRKGRTSAAYSGFEGFDDQGRSLLELLRTAGVTALDVVGLATDHCVRATALDAASAGFRVRVLLPLVAGVAPETTAAALEAMTEAGVELVDGQFSSPVVSN